MAELLITGTRSGLGRALHEALGGASMTRANASALLASKESFETVIHAAHSRAKDVTSDALAGYLADSVDLTAAVAGKATSHLVLVSTVSVYPLVGHDLEETTPVLLDRVPGFYGIAKLMSEARALEWGRQPGRVVTILRLSSMLGRHSPPNVTTRLLNRAVDQVPLTADSLFSYVHHDQIVAFVQRIIAERIGGTFNLAGAERIGLKEVAALAGCPVSFGNVVYEAPAVPIARATALLPALAEAPREMILREVSRLDTEGRPR